MKKLLYCMWVLLLFIPTLVFADTCDSSSVTIESIELVQATGFAKEIVKPKIVGKSVVLNLEMSFKGDFVKYAVTIHNGSEKDYVIDKSMVSNTKDYFNYTFESDDGYVKAGTTKRIILKVEYTDGIPDNEFVDNVFEYNDIVPLNLNSPKAEENPATGVKSLLYLIPIIFIIGVIFLTVNKKNKVFKVMSLLMFILIPTIVYAVCKCELNVNASIKVNKCKYKLVTDIGSFSTTEDVKEVCVNDAYDDYVFEYKREYHDVYGENTVSAMGVSFDGKPVYRVDLDIVSPSSYIRIYSDRNKTNLVKVYDNLYDYYHNRKYSVSYNNFYPATWEYYIELPEGEYYLDVSSDIENDYYSRVVYLEKLETVVINGLWSDSEDVYNMIDDLRHSIWVGCPTLQNSFKNSFKGKQVNLDYEPTLTFTDLVDDTICYDKILVGFTNCDNYNDYKALKESGTMTCSGNVYHAVWANSDDYYSREK